MVAGGLARHDPGRWGVRRARARAVMPAGPDWSDYLAIVEALRVDPLSGDRDAIFVDAFKSRASRETVAAWRADLGTGAGSPLLRAYLELSLICQYIVDDRNVTIAEAVQRFTTSRSSSIAPASAARRRLRT